MALTLLLESKITNTGTDFFWKVLGYWVHRTHARLDPGFSLSPTALSLATVIDVEFAKTVMSFLTSKDTNTCLRSVSSYYS